MATEGGGRHSPSTVVWEEEGVPIIVLTGPPMGVEPKVTDSTPSGRAAGPKTVVTTSGPVRE